MSRGRSADACRRSPSPPPPTRRPATTSSPSCLPAPPPPAATPTRNDIVDKLFTSPPRVFVRSFDRPNLRLAFKPKDRSSRQVLSFVRSHEAESGIVYCASRRKVEELAEALKAAGVNALPYHAGLDKTGRG